MDGTDDAAERGNGWNIHSFSSVSVFLSLFVPSLLLLIYILDPLLITCIINVYRAQFFLFFGLVWLKYEMEAIAEETSSQFRPDVFVHFCIRWCTLFA